MASGKKGKKNKGKTLALSDFLQETPGAVSTVPIRKSTLNWADEMEDCHDLYDSRAPKASVVLPTAPKASRDFDDVIDKVPQEPPYIAFLSNLPYDVDENEISAFFKNMKISNMRIPKDERLGEAPKLRGFGYVEFEDRESLLNALVIPDTMIKNRRIRIEVATDYGNDNRRAGGRMDMNRDRNPRSDVSSFGDWRSGPRQDSADSDRRGFSRDKDRDRDDGSNSTWRSNREPRDPEKSFARSRDDRDSDFGRSRGGDIRRYDESSSRWNRGGTGGERSFGRGPPPARDDDVKDEPRQRPKLILTPRTKPVENEPEKTATSAAAIFGNAKPVDTSAKERQIEERLARDHDQAVKREGSRDRGVVDRDKRRDASRDRRREGSRDRDRRREGSREKRDERDNREKKSEGEKRNVDKEKNQKTDVNGVVEKSHQQKRNGDVEKKELKPEKPEIRKKEEKKEKPKKEMPELKKVEPPNFIQSNKFAYLQTEEDSSD